MRFMNDGRDIRPWSATVVMQRRWMFIAVAISLALHAVALLGTSGLDFTRLYAEPEPQSLQVEIVMPPPAAPALASATQSAPKPKARKAPVRRQTVPPAPPRHEAADEVAPGSPAATAADAPLRLDENVGMGQDAEGEAASDEPAARSPPAYPIRSARLVFDLYYGESKTLVGEVVQTWQLNGDHYVAESSAEAVGFVSLFVGGRYVQRSEGTLGPDGFVPHTFTSRDRRRDEPERAAFDWDTGVVSFHRRGRERQAALVAGTQDPLSALHQLYFLRPLAPGLLMNVATTRKVETMLFQNMGEEEVMTATGPVSATHMKYQDLDGAITEAWLDPRRSLLPVRIYTLNRNGYMLDQVLREASAVSIDAPDGALPQPQ